MGTALVVYKPPKTEEFKINLQSPYGDPSSDMPMWSILDMIMFHVEEPYALPVYFIGDPKIYDPILEAETLSDKERNVAVAASCVGIVFATRRDAHNYIEENGLGQYRVYCIETLTSNIEVRDNDLYLRQRTHIAKCEK